MDQAAFDDFEQFHPPSAAWTFCSIRWCANWSPTMPTLGLVTPGVDHVVYHADQDLPAGVARWVRLAVGLAAKEYQLANAELEAIERVRGDQCPDRDSDLVAWLGEVNPQPRNQLLREGVQALVWLRAFTW
jgi:hypothetical protein